MPVKRKPRVASHQKKWVRAVKGGIWIIFLAFFPGLPLFVLAVSINLFGLFGEMPDTKDLENPENDVSSEVLSTDGVSLGRYFRFNRSLVSYQQLSPDLVKTLLISEDHRFYEHTGLDFLAFLRVIKGITTFSVSEAGGGSTLTQQLAKNLFTINPEHSLDGPFAKLGTYPRRIVQKTKEWIIAINLERNFTKEEIIAMYLNTTSFSYNSYGIKIASETYFNKSPGELNLQESAMLVGMLQNPVVFSPVARPENAIKKRNEVLAKLLLHGYKIKTRTQYDSIKSLPIGLQLTIQNQHKGLAPYFRTVLGNQLSRWCKERDIDLRTAGLKIYTTIDSRLQAYAEEAVAKHMKFLQDEFDKQWKALGKNPWVDENGKEIHNFLEIRIKRTKVYKELAARYGENSDSLKIMLKLKRPMKVFTWDGEKQVKFSYYDSLDHYKRFLQAGLMAMDPATGFIKAWVGGINHRYFEFDHVKQSQRQPGSTFKAFVYGLAMENGYSPCHKLKNVSPVFSENGRSWSPPNSDGTYGDGEEMTIRKGMALSVNTIAAQLMKELTPKNVVEFAQRMGITSKLDPVPSLALGTSDVSLYELVAAYSAFVNQGIYTEPFMILRIEDKNGNVLENFIPKTKQAISDQTAYKMVYMLRGGVEEEGGTSRGMNAELLRNNEVGGKTGTTNDASDGWYMGITPNLVTGVWVGGDERSIHFPSLRLGQGSKSAMPIWELFMLKAYADPRTGISKGQFKTPAERPDNMICVDSDL